jgi:site-specific DNA-cytosine methylase
MSDHVFTALFPFCGLGAGARGFIEAMAHLGTDSARFLNLGGIDVDAESCSDFERLAGGPALRADLHSLTPAELIAWLVAQHGRKIAERRPDAVFLSPPCKGMSRLLGTKAARAEKYQRLNGLVCEGLFLVLETWPDARPPLIVLENVPGIVQRGAELLDRARRMLSGYGYVFNAATHDCGEIGGLAQHRKRFLLVARDPRQVPAFVYQPPKKRVRGCGEVLGELALPGDPEAGPLHRLPLIDWVNWVRLALIPPGGDWRDLPRTVQLAADNPNRHEAKLRVEDFSQPAHAVTGATRPNSGAPSVADPRVLGLNLSPNAHNNLYVVGAWEEPAKTVIGATRPGSGAAAVADPHLEKLQPGLTATNAGTWKGRPGFMGVLDWREPSRTVVGRSSVSGGHASAAVAEPFGHVNLVLGWDQPSGTVTHAPAPSSGGGAVADPRVPGLEISDSSRGGALGVIGWAEPAPTITGSMEPARSNTPGSVADPRFRGSLGVTAWQAPARTVTGESYPSNGAASVADPRLVSPVQPGQARREVIGRHRVLDWRHPSPVVAGPGSNGAQNIADVRAEALVLGCSPRAGVYGVLSWEQAAATVIGEARVDNGRYAVADPRPGDPGWRPPEGVIPVIISPWGCWHRPLTTLELAALQGLPATLNGKPLELAGRAVSRWRERIGNAVPVQAGTAIAVSLLKALLASAVGHWSILFGPGGAAVWVRDDGRDEHEVGPSEGVSP